MNRLNVRKFRLPLAAAALAPAASAPAVLAVVSLATVALGAPVPLRAVQLQQKELDPLPTVARIHYGGGGDWYANPSSLPNLLEAIRLRTTLRVATRPGEVSLSDPDLGDYPFLHLTGHGNVRFSETELRHLRDYLEHGGFLHADDNYGLDASFRREIRRLYPDRELTDVPLDHPIYHIVYEFPEGLPKIHEHDGLPAQGLGLFIDGRLTLFYSYQTDLGDGWEDPSVHQDSESAREQALRMGVNLFVYALTATPRL